MVPRENLKESVVRTGRDLPVSMPYNFFMFENKLEEAPVKDLLTLLG